MSRRLLLVSHRPLQYEGPGTVRWRALTEFLPEHGWDVTAVTARLNPSSDELSADPRVARLSSARAGVMRQVGRVLRPATNRVLGVQPEAFPPSMAWSLTGRKVIERAARETAPDVVVATAPPFASLFAAGSVARRRRLPVVADMRDPWAGHPTYDAGGALLPRVEGHALRPFDLIVVVTPGMAERLENFHPEFASRVHVLPNGFAPQLLGRRSEPRERDGSRTRLIHPGVLYGDRSLRGLLDGVERSGLASQLRLELVGNATAESRAVLRGAPTGLEVIDSGPLNWESTMRRVEDSDVVVVIVPETMGDDVAWPVKMFEALALGKPILAITSGGATEALLRDLGQASGCARDDDVAGIARAIREVVTRPPPPVDPGLLARWDRAQVAADYARLLDTLVERRGASPSSAEII